MKKLVIIILIFILSPFPRMVFAPSMHQSYDSNAILTRMINEKRIRERIEYNRSIRDFKNDLAFRESSNNWRKYNPYGYIGKFQFGEAALDVTGYGHISFVDFIDNPAIFPEKEQEKAMDSLLMFNEYILKDYIEKYEGSLICDSIPVSRIGLLAASHLAGPGNVKRFLNTKGRYNPKDRMGTRLSDYLLAFSDY
jgi:hypothetical protein